MLKKNAHCSYCGQRFADGAAWPRTCAGCQNISYVNPTPVAVLVLPVDGGVLCVRRGIAPAIGELSLPGGFLERHETWQQGAARELFEETGVRVDAGEVELLDVLSVTDAGLVLIFGKARQRAAAELPPFVPCEEATERVVVRRPVELAFPTHTQVLRAFLTGKA
jgi:ADP-ribose pyrophosphatase YjhB (NUDIX family)